MLVGWLRGWLAGGLSSMLLNLIYFKIELHNRNKHLYSSYIGNWHRRDTCESKCNQWLSLHYWQRGIFTVVCLSSQSNACVFAYERIIVTHNTEIILLLHHIVFVIYIKLVYHSLITKNCSSYALSC